MFFFDDSLSRLVINWQKEKFWKREYLNLTEKANLEVTSALERNKLPDGIYFEIYITPE